MIAPSYPIHLYTPILCVQIRLNLVYMGSSPCRASSAHHNRDSFSINTLSHMVTHDGNYIRVSILQNRLGFRRGRAGVAISSDANNTKPYLLKTKNQMKDIPRDSE